MQRQPKPVPELQTERRQFIGKLKAFGRWPDGCDLVGRDTRLDQRYRMIKPFTRLVIGVNLRRG